MKKSEHIVRCEACIYWSNFPSAIVKKPFCTKLCKTKVIDGKVIPELLFCEEDDFCKFGTQIGYQKYEFEPGEIEY